jgi:hypothetical protein
MIYSVVPEELAGELYDRLVEYYKDDPNVTVIVDRRKRGHRLAGVPDAPPGGATTRDRRDRRRPHVPSTLGPLDAA